MNHNGTALFEGVTVMFLAQAFNVDLSLADQLGQALKQEDLDKARQDLEKLVRGLQQGSASQRNDKAALAEGLRRAAQALSGQRPERAGDDPKKDEWQERSKAEQKSREEQALREEERRLKKKLAEKPEDEESVRRLKKVQRDLERGGHDRDADVDRRGVVVFEVGDRMKRRREKERACQRKSPTGVRTKARLGCEQIGWKSREVRSTVAGVGSSRAREGRDRVVTHPATA